MLLEQTKGTVKTRMTSDLRAVTPLENCRSGGRKKRQATGWTTFRGSVTHLCLLDYSPLAKWQPPPHRKEAGWCHQGVHRAPQQGPKYGEIMHLASHSSSQAGR